MGKLIDRPGRTGRPVGQLPPLESGDRLSREEFERRYGAMPDLKKAELIEGVVYVPSPVRHIHHGQPHLLLSGWINNYVAATPGVNAGSESTVRLDEVNEPQPDVVLRVLPSHGGRCRAGTDDYLEGAPDLIGEVAASSASYDLHPKLDAYLRNGVREYLVPRTFDREVDWFVLREGRYERIQPDPEGILRSEVFPGLWLDPRALLEGDAARVLDVLRRGLASPEHSAFAARLAEKARASR